MNRAIVLYDEDCGFCRWSADRIRAWDRRESLAFAAIQGRDGDRWLGSMDRAARYSSWHLVTPDRRVWSGGAAVPHALRRLPFGAAPAAVLAAFPAATDRLYGWVARHRGQLGSVLRSTTCAVDPRDIADR